MFCCSCSRPHPDWSVPALMNSITIGMMVVVFAIVCFCLLFIFLPLLELYGAEWLAVNPGRLDRGLRGVLRRQRRRRNEAPVFENQHIPAQPEEPAAADADDDDDVNNNLDVSDSDNDDEHDHDDHHDGDFLFDSDSEDSEDSEEDSEETDEDDTDDEDTEAEDDIGNDEHAPRVAQLPGNAEQVLERRQFDARGGRLNAQQAPHAAAAVAEAGDDNEKHATADANLHDPALDVFHGAMGSDDGGASAGIQSPHQDDETSANASEAMAVGGDAIARPQDEVLVNRGFENFQYEEQNAAVEPMAHANEELPDGDWPVPDQDGAAAADNVLDLNEEMEPELNVVDDVEDEVVEDDWAEEPEPVVDEQPPQVEIVDDLPIENNIMNFLERDRGARGGGAAANADDGNVNVHRIFRVSKMMNVFSYVVQGLSPEQLALCSAAVLEMSKCSDTVTPYRCKISYVDRCPGSTGEIEPEGLAQQVLCFTVDSANCYPPHFCNVW